MEARRKRERAADARGLARLISFKSDREALLAQAAQLEAEADEIERQLKT